MFAGLIAIFIGLVYYNYSLSRKGFVATKNSIVGINLTSLPKPAQFASPASFTWEISSTKDFKTNFTTIYYGFTSTPSALTKKDSPSAVGYPYLTIDYLQGSFSLPDTFSTNIFFNKPGRVWYRAYAKVGDDHLWTEEKYIDVLP